MEFWRVSPGIRLWRRQEVSSNFQIQKTLRTFARISLLRRQSDIFGTMKEVVPCKMK